MNLEKESLFNRLTCLDKKSIKVTTKLDEPTKILYSTFKELKGDVDEHLVEGYCDMTILALSHILFGLIKDTMREDPELGGKLYSKVMKILSEV